MRQNAGHTGERHRRSTGRFGLKRSRGRSGSAPIASAWHTRLRTAASSRQRGLGTASFSSISIATRGLPVPQAANCRRLRCWHGSNVAPARMRCPRVCVAVVDCSWCELARRSNVLPKTVRGWTLAALEALAALWGARPPF